MQREITPICHQVSAALQGAGVKLPLGHVYELVATSLGYGSRAALTQSSIEPLSITKCEYLAVDVPKVVARAVGLGHTAQAAEQFLEDFVEVVRHFGPTVVTTDADLLDDLWDKVTSAVYDDEGIASEAATTNAYYDEVEAWAEDPAEHPTQSDESWACPIAGVLHMDQDPERPWSGDEVSFDGEVVFTKCGKAGLIFDRVEIGNASVVWDEPEPDTE